MDCDIHICFFKDGFCEIIPGAVTFIGCLIGSVFFCFHHITKEFGKIVSISRGSDLVVDHIQIGVRFSKLEHRSDKVMAIDSKNP